MEDAFIGIRFMRSTLLHTDKEFKEWKLEQQVSCMTKYGQLPRNFVKAAFVGGNGHYKIFDKSEVRSEYYYLDIKVVLYGLLRQTVKLMQRTTRSDEMESANNEPWSFKWSSLKEEGPNEYSLTVTLSYKIENGFRGNVPFVLKVNYLKFHLVYNQMKKNFF